MRFLSIIFFLLMLIGCGEEVVVKPSAELRLEYPEASYNKTDTDCPFDFVKNELAMLDDQVWQEEQERALEAASRRSAMNAHDEVTGTRRRKRTLLSRILPFGLLRGTFRNGGRSDYL